MSVEKYFIAENEKIPSEEFNKIYSPVVEERGLFVYEIHNSAITLINRNYQTYPSHTYVGEFTLIGVKENNKKALAEIRLNGFNLETLTE